MFPPSSSSTGTTYTATAALFAVAGIFIPAIVLLSSPVTYATLYGAAAGIGMISALAWTNWKRNSNLSIPSITGRGAE